MEFPSAEFHHIIRAEGKRLRVLQLVPASGFYVARPDPSGRRHSAIPVACFALIVDEQGEQEILPVGFNGACLDLLAPDLLHHVQEREMNRETVKWLTGAGIPADPTVPPEGEAERL